MSLVTCIFDCKRWNVSHIGSHISCNFEHLLTNFYGWTITLWEEVKMCWWNVLILCHVKLAGHIQNLAGQCDWLLFPGLFLFLYPSGKWFITPHNIEGRFPTLLIHINTNLKNLGHSFGCWFIYIMQSVLILPNFAYPCPIFRYG